MLAADYPFLDILWTMFIFFLFVIWIWILITVFADIFRRKDIGGGMKAIWIIFVIVLPYLGVLVYLIAEPRRDGRPEHRADAEAAQAQQDDYIQSVAGRAARRRDREGQGAARLGRDHAGRVRRAQAEGAGLRCRRHFGCEGADERSSSRKQLSDRESR